MLKVEFELREYPERGELIPLDNFKFEGDLREFVYFLKTHLALVDFEKSILSKAQYQEIHYEHPLIPQIFKGSIEQYIDKITKNISKIKPKNNDYIKSMALERRAFISIHRDYYDLPGYAFLSIEGSPPKGFALLRLEPEEYGASLSCNFAITKIELFPYGFFGGELFLSEPFETSVMNMLALSSYDKKIKVGVI